MACVTMVHWEDAVAAHEYLLDIGNISPYVSGQFYRRELPCLLAILNELPAPPEVVVIDGYVWLDGNHRPGLGGYLFDALKKSIPVIGVAKTRFATAAGEVEVYRGSSRRPLLVTSAGMDPQVAADCIRRMHGPNRVPTLLKRVDQLTRSDDSVSLQPCELPDK